MTELTVWFWAVRSAKFFPGCRHYFFRPIQLRHGDSKLPTQKFFRSQLTGKVCLPRLRGRKRGKVCLPRLGGRKRHPRARRICFTLSTFCKCVVSAGGTERFRSCKESRVASFFCVMERLFMRKRQRHTATKRCLKSSHGNLSNLLTTVPSVPRLRQSRCRGTRH